MRTSGKLALSLLLLSMALVPLLATSECVLSVGLDGSSSTGRAAVAAAPHSSIQQAQQPLRQLMRPLSVNAALAAC